MKTITLFFIILIIYLVIEEIIQLCKKELFNPMSDDGYASISSSIGKTISSKKDYFNEKNCCLVTKHFDKENNKFEYKYEKKNKCKVQNNNMQNFFIEGINGWDNKKCKKPDLNDDDYLGSCRRINFECKDFVTRKECEKYDMEWSDKTCDTSYQKPFQIKEREVEFGSKILKV